MHWGYILVPFLTHTQCEILSHTIHLLWNLWVVVTCICYQCSMHTQIRTCDWKLWVIPYLSLICCNLHKIAWSINIFTLLSIRFRHLTHLSIANKVLSLSWSLTLIGAIQRNILIIISYLNHFLAIRLLGILLLSKCGINDWLETFPSYLIFCLFKAYFLVLILTVRNDHCWVVYVLPIGPYYIGRRCMYWLV